MNYSKYDGHTPRPWKIKRRKQRTDAWAREERKNWIGYHRTILQDSSKYRYRPVCKLIDSMPDAYSWGANEKEAEANAQLIADAPMLLERVQELESILRMLKKNIEWTPIDKWDEWYKSVALDYINAVLDKNED